MRFALEKSGERIVHRAVFLHMQMRFFCGMPLSSSLQQAHLPDANCRKMAIALTTRNRPVNSRVVDSDITSRLRRAIPSFRVVRHSGVTGRMMSLRGLLPLCRPPKSDLAILPPALVRFADCSFRWQRAIGSEWPTIRGVIDSGF